MKEKIKKSIIIAGFIITVVGLAYLLYYFFFKPAERAPLTNVNLPLVNAGQLPLTNTGQAGNILDLNINGALPTITQLPPEVNVSNLANGGLTKVNALTKTAVDYPMVSPGGQISYYNASDGRFYRINPDGSLTLMSDARFYQVQNVTWSADANKAVLEYPDGSNVVYDFAAKKQFSLPKEMQSFAFSTDNAKLSAQVIGPQAENNWLVTFNSDGSNIQFVERLGDNGDDVANIWSPNQQVVALFRKNSGSNSQDVILIGQHDENFRALAVNGGGFEGQWTPSGDRLLYDVYQAGNGFKPTLWIAGAQGDNIGVNNTDLGLETWSYKCAVSADNQTAYCGVPTDLPNGSGVYRDLASDSLDNFYRIDLNTGQRGLLAQPIGDQGGYNVQNIFLSQDNRTLYFQDSLSGGVYSLNLP